jgi:hypothetical protein
LGAIMVSSGIVTSVTNCATSHVEVGDAAGAMVAVTPGKVGNGAVVDVAVGDGAEAVISACPVIAADVWIAAGSCCGRLQPASAIPANATMKYLIGALFISSSKGIGRAIVIQSLEKCLPAQTRRRPGNKGSWIGRAWSRRRTNNWPGALFNRAGPESRLCKASRGTIVFRTPRRQQPGGWLDRRSRSTRSS